MAPAGAPPYAGPPYEVVITDENIGPAGLSQYWVTIENLDVSSTAYRDAVKEVVSDVAAGEQSADVIVTVVTDRKIAEAESPSTVLDFIEEYGDDYLVNAIPTLEVEGWVASYSGGLNPDQADPTDALDGYEILWWPYGDLEVEAWKPDLPAST
ncbi:hypothetical protein [Serinibacter arcticus]|uniref:hypothetical protein n=1 Tax=Serinibacter arcticus TaxID=1655435 RepID=UPI0011B1E939|nr:hypothetical protein [Serinibacter arcticus]